MMKFSSTYITGSQLIALDKKGANFKIRPYRLQVILGSTCYNTSVAAINKYNYYKKTGFEVNL